MTSIFYPSMEDSWVVGVLFLLSIAVLIAGILLVYRKPKYRKVTGIVLIIIPALQLFIFLLESIGRNYDNYADQHIDIWLVYLLVVLLGLISLFYSSRYAKK